MIVHIVIIIVRVAIALALALALATAIGFVTVIDMIIAALITVASLLQTSPSNVQSHDGSDDSSYTSRPRCWAARHMSGAFIHAEPLTT